MHLGERARTLRGTTFVRNNPRRTMRGARSSISPRRRERHRFNSEIPRPPEPAYTPHSRCDRGGFL